MRAALNKYILKLRLTPLIKAALVMFFRRACSSDGAAILNALP